MITYTFFREKSGGSARIYQGTFENENEIRQPVSYRIDMTRMTSTLYDGNNIQTMILRSTYLNENKKKVMIEANHNNNIPSFTMKNSGLLNEKWKWNDPFYPMKSYQWKVDFFGTSWKLKGLEDDTTIILASFERAEFSKKKQGVLTIYYQVPPYLLICILFTHKIVHQSIKNEEVEAVTESFSNAVG